MGTCQCICVVCPMWRKNENTSIVLHGLWMITIFEYNCFQFFIRILSPWHRNLNLKLIGTHEYFLFLFICNWCRIRCIAMSALKSIKIYGREQTCRNTKGKEKEIPRASYVFHTSLTCNVEHDRKWFSHSLGTCLYRAFSADDDHLTDNAIAREHNQEVGCNLSTA